MSLLLIIKILVTLSIISFTSGIIMACSSEFFNYKVEKRLNITGTIFTILGIIFFIGLILICAWTNNF